MKKPKVFYLIAVGGYLKEPDIEKICFSPKELEEHEGYDSAKQMVDEIIEEAVAEHNQRFTGAVVLKEKDWNRLVKKANTLPNEFRT